MITKIQSLLLNYTSLHFFLLLINNREFNFIKKKKNINFVFLHEYKNRIIRGN